MAKKETTPKNDLQDSPSDNKKMQQDETTLDLPEVKDIPGQEHVRPMPFNEMKDTTPSSADEEAEELLSDVNEDDEVEDDDSNVTAEEKELLRQTSESMSSDEDQDVRNARVDNVDDEGDQLNEAIDGSGRELDVPGAEDDDDNEDIGEEDEENNDYSLGDNK
ncbi:hypothetical protein QTN47_09775 [Danxiaibacter flavus]|uniref:Uncharacterized protein n=1 Tax=Danxiaibacter flavus TaxID=3049108 RepID=A0ABV3ZD25_9BACT|nr:hypothetical protein QNM32_09775 [Chitinophagaceae bacterium DXS]